MLSIGRGSGTINGLRPATSNSNPIIVFEGYLISGEATITLGKQSDQPTLHAIRGKYEENGVYISPASNTKLLVLASNTIQYIESGRKHFSFSDEEAVLVLAF